MEALTAVTDQLDQFFRISESGEDPAFSRFLPAAYEADGRAWRTWMEPEFATNFNGLMIRGSDTVHTVFLAAFPSDAILHDFLTQARRGDLLFLHHPIDLQSGDPRGAWGRFFRPIPVELLDRIRAKRLSIYSCHAPLDYHPNLSTARSIASALDGSVTGEFFPYGPGYAGVIATIAATSTADLERALCRIFAVPYLDTAGARPPVIETLAIVAGSGDRVEQMKIAEAARAQAYITGEIHSRIDTDYGHRKFGEVQRFAATSGMALLGVSHAASEFLVMQREMRTWFAERFVVDTVPLPEKHWWR